MSMVLEVPAFLRRHALFGSAALSQANLQPVRRAGEAPTFRRGAASSGPQKSANRLRFAQNRGRDRAGAFGAPVQDPVQVTGIGHQSSHFAADPAQNLNREL